MAHYGDHRGGTNWTSSVNSVYEDIEPSYGWVGDTENHYLIIHLPGFKREEVKLEVDIFDNIIVSGERKVSEYKSIRFQKSMKAPEKSKSEDTSARLEDGNLYVIIPKESSPENNERDEAAIASSDHKENQQKEKEEIESSKGDETDQKENDKEGMSEDDEEFHDAKMAKKWHEGALVTAGKEILWKNKTIVITAVLAFSFGVFVSQKCQSK